MLKKIGLRISIHAAREGGDYVKNLIADVADISIHAAREGGDQRTAERSRYQHISIHAAREGGDPQCRLLRKARTKFQSTPPVKAATAVSVDLPEFFHISIHAAREGGDCKQ